jgi:hypothetical protein
VFTSSHIPTPAHIENTYTTAVSYGVFVSIKSRRMRLAGHVARIGEKVIGRKARGKETTRKTKT